MHEDEFDEVSELELLEEARSQIDTASHSDQFSDDLLICECMCISLGEIRGVLRDKETDLFTLQKELGLGSGCSSCVKTFEQWKKKI